MDLDPGQFNAVIDGLIRNDPTRVLYLHFDYRLLTRLHSDTDLALGIHYLCFSSSQTVRMIAKVNDDFLIENYQPVEPEAPNCLQWQIMSDHDSCWRTDGWSIFREICLDQVYDQKHGYQEIANELYPNEIYDFGSQPKTFTTLETCKLLTLEEVQDVEYIGYRDSRQRFIPEYYIKQEV